MTVKAPVLTNFKLTTTIARDPNGDITVRITCGDARLDRSDVAAFGFSGTKRSLGIARRLKKAVDAGAAFNMHEVCANNGGETYLSASPFMMGKYMDADLRKLGY